MLRTGLRKFSGGIKEGYPKLSVAMCLYGIVSSKMSD